MPGLYRGRPAVLGPGVFFVERGDGPGGASRYATAMKRYQFDQFGLEHLRLVEVDPPVPGAGEVLIEVRAASLNYRDLLVIGGGYNSKLPLPATPLSDAAGTVVATGPGATRFRAGDAVVTHFVADWGGGPFRSEYLATTLGTPGAGMAAEQVVVPERALLPMPAMYEFGEAATLPIAALTAWSALVTEGELLAGQTVLTLGTGGVSIFAVQLASALGARVLITSSSDGKLKRVAHLGADVGINYVTHPRWSREVLSATDGVGVDLVVENGGIGTLAESLRCTRAGGRIAMLGALTGLQGEADIAAVLMKRIRIAGVLVDSRAAFEDLLAFLADRSIRPVIGAEYGFDELPEALRMMQSGHHFGKIILRNSEQVSK